MKIINKLINSRFFEYLNNFLKRRIIRIFKIYFVVSSKQNLPENNYPVIFSKKYQEFIIKNFNSKKYSSKNSCNYLRQVVDSESKRNFILNFLDFGAGDINTFLELKSINNLKYLYHDLKDRNKIIKFIKDKYSFENLEVVDDIINYNKNIDFAFFGSSIGYTKSYEEILNNLINLNCKFFLFTGIIFFKKDNYNQKQIVLKQTNLMPNINYVYMFNYDIFKKQFEKNNYQIIFKKNNQYNKINFKNLNFFSESIEYVDIFFKKI